MSTLEIIGGCLGIPLTLLGLVGGLLSLRGAFVKWRKEGLKHGRKGVSIIYLGREDKGDVSEYHFLAAGDLYQIVFPLVRDTSARITSIRQIGDYYEFKAECDPGTDLKMVLKKRDPKTQGTD